MKPVIFVFLAFFIIVSASPNTFQKQHYQSSRFGLAITYPTPWFISENLGLLDLFNPEDVVESVEGPLFATISIKMYSNSDQQPLIEVARRLLLQNSTTSQPTDLQITPLSLNNPQIDSAIIVEGIPSWSSVSVTMVAVDDKVYLFSLNIGFLSDLEDKRSYYDQILLDILTQMEFSTPEWEGYDLTEPYRIAATIVADQFDYPLGDPSTTSWGLMQAFNNFFDNPRYNSYHAAEDWYQRDGATAGEPIFAVADGIVKYATFANYPGDVVILEHLLPGDEVWYSMYGHMGSRDVAQGDTVKRGDKVGTVYYWPGNSHLHFEIRRFYMEDEINGENSALSRHRNYPPGPGYWPVGEFRETDERPPDRGWVEPSTFIETYKRFQSTTPSALYGQVRLQGRTNYSGSTIIASPYPCPSLDDDPPIVTNVVSQTVHTDAFGYFEIVPPIAEIYQCLQIEQTSFLSAEHAVSSVGDVGTVTLANGDLNGDNKINIYDMTLVSANYDLEDYLDQTDLNRDGVVNIFDLTLVANNYGRQGPITTWD